MLLCVKSLNVSRQNGRCHAKKVFRCITLVLNLNILCRRLKTPFVAERMRSNMPFLGPQNPGTQKKGGEGEQIQLASQGQMGENSLIWLKLSPPSFLCSSIYLLGWVPTKRGGGGEKSRFSCQGRRTMGELGEISPPPLSHLCLFKGRKILNQRREGK